ncbi:response regulator [Devosia submarina]|uniref:response regulator n=1 Tax=Devosia submarina TaxID=1173082 RepID=UPI000D3978B3|nr:response regulator [Devosia submarina]
MASEEAADLNGKRIVVVEDDFVLATDICRSLRDLGATVLGPAPTPFYAMHLIGRKKIDAAVLDVRLHGTTVFEVADMLRDQGVPIIFATASDRKSMPNRFRESPLLEKPFDRKKLVNEIHAVTRRPVVRPTSPLRTILPSTQREAPAQMFARALARSFAR